MPEDNRPSRSAGARLVQLADFDRSRGGAFLEFLGGIGDDAIKRGWGSDCVFFESAAEAPWIDDLSARGIRVHLAPDELRGSDRRLSRWLDELVGDGGPPTILHSHFTGFDLAVAGAARGREDRKAIWHLHGPLPRSPWHRARAVVKLGVIGRAVDLMLCPAQNIVDDAVARGAPRSRVQFFPSAIDPSSAPFATPEERLAARRRLDIDPDATVLLHFGWHWELKGGELFVRTVEEMVRTWDGEVLGVERGGGSEYSDLARNLGIGDHLRVQDQVPEVQLLHRAADVQVASSLIEGMAYGVLESLCTGTPVVATDIPGHAFLAEHVAACRIERHDAGDLARVTTEMLWREPALREREALQARAWIESNLSIEILAGQMASLYEDVLAGRPWNAAW